MPFEDNANRNDIMAILSKDQLAFFTEHERSWRRVVVERVHDEDVTEFANSQ